MRIFTTLLVIIISTSINYTQQFSGLNGLEDEQGNTILLYSFGNNSVSRIYDPVFKYNVNTETETKIIDAFSGATYPSYWLVKSANDYEFLPNDIENFINVGWIYNPDSGYAAYAARNDTLILTINASLSMVDISKQYPNKVYISNGFYIYRSFDGGYSYQEDSTIEFQFLSVADFDDRVFFGLTESFFLTKSEDLGVTYTIVDGGILPIFPGYIRFYYDIDQLHMYRTNPSSSSFTLNVSNNKGNASSWSQTYESDIRIYITIDSSNSGLIYLADGKQIYKSTDYGYNFSLYKNLPRKIVGLYKKPNSEILYAVSKYKLYQITPDTIMIIKSVPVSESELAYYPLAKGNKWFYLETIVDSNSTPPTYIYNINLREVLKDTILANGKRYFKLYDNTTLNDTNFLFERIDTLEGLIYRYDFNSSSGADEYLIDDLLAEEGDTVLSSRWRAPQTFIPNVTCIEQKEHYIFGAYKSKKTFLTNYLSSYSYGLVEGFGVDAVSFDWELGYSQSILKGCVINRIVYGDTVLTDVDDRYDIIPAEFILEQNYPNPFNPSTKISWQAPESGWQTLKVYDVLGNEVATLVDEYKSTGSYEVEFNASQLQSGVYFYRLQTGSFVETKKMILLK